MRLLVRLLSVLAFVLTCAQGAALLMFVYSESTYIQTVNSPPALVKHEPVQILSKDRSSGILSRLGLVPKDYHEQKLAAVIIENHEGAREHQEGLEQAVFIQEWMVEGLISRFIVLFDTSQLPDRIGPVRSLRPYFVKGVAAWTQTFFHAGGSPEALELVTEGEMLRSINGITGKYNDFFERDHAIAAPHNLFLPKSVVTRFVDEFAQEPVLWPPYSIGKAKKTASGATRIELNYYNALHNIEYTYQESAKTYRRVNGHTTSFARPSNVLIAEIPIMGEGEFGRLNMDTNGDGKLLLFRDGKVFEGTWQKENMEDSFRFFAEDGSSLQFARGLTWMTVLPTLHRVEWGVEESD